MRGISDTGFGKNVTGDRMTFRWWEGALSGDGEKLAMESGASIDQANFCAGAAKS